jgi:hypothetical protein
MRSWLRNLIARLRKHPIAYSYLQPADRAVVDGLEKFERVFARDQPEYIPLRALRSNTHDGRVMSRWTLTPQQRRDVTNGADIFLTLMTFNGPLQPITIAIGDDLNPDYFRHHLNLEQEQKESVDALHHRH